MTSSDLGRAVRAARVRFRALVASVAAFVLAIARRLRPWPAIESRPYPCAACKVEYSDPRALGWHMRGHHVDVCDADTVDPSIAREAELERRRALEELDLS